MSNPILAAQYEDTVTRRNRSMGRVFFACRLASVPACCSLFTSARRGSSRSVLSVAAAGKARLSEVQGDETQAPKRLRGMGAARTERPRIE